jgi:hypothetical protein
MNPDYITLVDGDDECRAQLSNPRELNKIEVNDWDKAQTILGVLLDSGYVARVVKCERTYIIVYDWEDEDWSGRRLIWVEDVE